MLTDKQNETFDKNSENEASYQRHRTVVDEAKSAYNDAFKAVFDQLRPEQFEPFSEILRGQAGSELNATEMLDEVRPKMVDYMNVLTNYFFETNDVEKKLIMMEVLKERYKGHEGTKWDVHNLTPSQRTLPIRLRIKNASIKFLKSQIEQQESQIAATLAENKENRDNLQKIKARRLLLQNAMEVKTARFEELKPKLLELNQKLNMKFSSVEYPEPMPSMHVVKE